MKLQRFIIPVCIVAVIALTACRKSQPEVFPTGGAYERAVELAGENDFDGAMDALQIALDMRRDTCQRALLDPAFHALRDEKSFRDAIRDAVIKFKIRSMQIAPEDEPGEWLEIEGTVVDAGDKPIPDAIVHVFGTDENGYYHPTIEGESTPRLFGILVTSVEGKFWFRTIRPGPYPGTRNARHFHIWASAPGKRMAVPHYAVFDDDPLLQLPENAEQRGEAVRIRMEEPTHLETRYGTIVLPMR